MKLSYPSSILLGIALLVVTGCQYNPFALRFLKREPSVSEASGTYVLKEVYVDMVDSSLSEKIRIHRPIPKIILQADGEAEFSDFPLFKQSGTFDYSFTGYMNFKARWTITSAGTVSSGGSDTYTVYGISIAPTDMTQPVDSATFTGKKTPDGMIFTLYDGDQGQILGFQKQ